MAAAAQNERIGAGETDCFGPERCIDSLNAACLKAFACFAVRTLHLGCVIFVDCGFPLLCRKASERIELLKKQKEREELRECTFKPKVSTEGRSVLFASESLPIPFRILQSIAQRWPCPLLQPNLPLRCPSALTCPPVSGGASRMTK
jgi:hypothetical protein